jgi:hypothetical protein
MIYLEVLMGCLALSFVAVPVTLALLARRGSVKSDQLSS